MMRGIGGKPMDPITFRAETPLQALLVEHALAMARQLEHAADQAAHGRVLTAVETFAVPAGRELTRIAVQAALQAQADPVEKKRNPLGNAPAGRDD
jgi:hypothetical protein